MKRTKHTYDSIVLAVCFCVVAMVCGLLTFAIATATISGPDVTVTDVFIAKGVYVTVFSGVTAIFILLAFYALPDGRRKGRQS